MNFDVSQSWINTLSANDWKSACVDNYWQDVFEFKKGECLFANGVWNQSLLAQYDIDKSDLTQSLMYLTNTVVTDNPHPAFWALRQMKNVFPDLFSSEFAICFNQVFTNHPNLITDFFAIGGGAEEFSAVINTLIKDKQTHFIPDVLQHFVIAKNDAKIYGKLEGAKKAVYKSIGLTNGENSSLRMEWFNTAHIQNAIEKNSLFQEIVRDITDMYPSPRAIECLTSYIYSEHQSPTANKIIVQRILNAPMEKQSLGFLETMVQNEMFLAQTLTTCINQNWLFNNPETIQKFFSIVPHQAIEDVFAKICNKTETNLLDKANALCEWMTSDFHARITQMAVLSVCKKHNHLYNNMQKMTLVSELHSEQKPQSRKM